METSFETISINIPLDGLAKNPSPPKKPLQLTRPEDITLYYARVKSFLQLHDFSGDLLTTALEALVHNDHYKDFNIVFNAINTFQYKIWHTYDAVVFMLLNEAGRNNLAKKPEYPAVFEAFANDLNNIDIQDPFEFFERHTKAFEACVRDEPLIDNVATFVVQMGYFFEIEDSLKYESMEIRKLFEDINLTMALNAVQIMMDANRVIMNLIPDIYVKLTLKKKRLAEVDGDLAEEFKNISLSAGDHTINVSAEEPERQASRPQSLPKSEVQEPVPIRQTQQRQTRSQTRAVRVAQSQSPKELEDKALKQPTQAHKFSKEEQLKSDQLQKAQELKQAEEKKKRAEEQKKTEQRKMEQQNQELQRQAELQRVAQQNAERERTAKSKAERERVVRARVAKAKAARAKAEKEEADRQRQQEQQQQQQQQRQRRRQEQDFTDQDHAELLHQMRAEQLQIYNPDWSPEHTDLMARVFGSYQYHLDRLNFESLNGGEDREEEDEKEDEEERSFSVTSNLEEINWSRMPHDICVWCRGNVRNCNCKIEEWMD